MATNAKDMSGEWNSSQISWGLSEECSCAGCELCAGYEPGCECDSDDDLNE